MSNFLILLTGLPSSTAVFLSDPVNLGGTGLSSTGFGGAGGGGAGFACGGGAGFGGGGAVFTGATTTGCKLTHTRKYLAGVFLVHYNDVLCNLVMNDFIMLNYSNSQTSKFLYCLYCKTRTFN